MILSYKYRLYPTKSQRVFLEEMLRDMCNLYNAALEQRIWAWDRHKIGLSYYDQTKELPVLRQDETYGRWSAALQQQTLRRLDKAMKRFFARVKRGEKPGFPRFRASKRFRSAEFRVGNGLTIKKSSKVGIVGIGEIKAKWHRQLSSKPKSAIVTCQNGKWYVLFHVEIAEGERRDGETIGIDVGLTSLVALSTGETIARFNHTKRHAAAIRRRQRALARARRGSQRRIKAKARLAQYCARVAASRRDYLHKLSDRLTREYAGIAVEDLDIRGMTQTKGNNLSKEIHDASWGILIQMLDYKAAKAGSQVIRVDPRYTSQTCPDCGTIKKKYLNERRHECDCGSNMDRDVAAAIVIHNRAFKKNGLGTSLRPLNLTQVEFDREAA